MGLYLLLTLVSLVIDRRAFMVSALVYVLVALTKLLDTYGLAGDSFAYVGVFIGFSLLLLSGFWHKVRYQLVRHLPASWQAKVPVIQLKLRVENEEVYVLCRSFCTCEAVD